MQRHKSPAKHVAILGGSFDPVHVGHIRPALEAARAFGLDKVVFVPNRRSPYPNKIRLTAARHRLAMLQLITRSDHRFAISHYELKRPRVSYTIHTLLYFRKRFPNRKLFFMCGLDSYLTLPSWRQVDRLLRLANLIVIERARLKPKQREARKHVASRLGLKPSGKNRLKLEGSKTEVLFFKPKRALGISSSRIRKSIQENKPWGQWVAPSVRSYIIDHNLYQREA